MKKGKMKSMKINMILNAIKSVMAIIFPLISFPYISRILGVETIGRYNFATSIISYFILLSGLGINTYAIRECSKLRDNKNKLNRLADQIFSINVISTLASYLLLFLFILLVPKFHEYRIILIILSLQIIFRTVGIEWLYSAYEDYLYITVRSIMFQLISIIALFLFVKTENDVNVYAMITVLANVGSNILNYIHSKKYCNVRFTLDMNLKKHLKPILVLFALNITVSIYINSDITILGFMDSEYIVGIYSVSTKVYAIVKNLLSSIIIVSIPRLAYLLGNNDKKGFSNTASEIYKMLFTLILPATLGIILLSKEIILIISGTDYLEATISLMLLGISLICVYGAYFWSQCILIPFKKDNVVLKATIISAIVNIVLNFILIPFWHQNAAAFTTIIAELIVFYYCRREGKKLVDLDNIFILTLKILVGCIGIAASVFLVKLIFSNQFIVAIFSIILSVLVYLTMEILLQNEVMLSIMQNLKSKIIRKPKN